MLPLAGPKRSFAGVAYCNWPRPKGKPAAFRRPAEIEIVKVESELIVKSHITIDQTFPSYRNKYSVEQRAPTEELAKYTHRFAGGGEMTNPTAQVPRRIPLHLRSERPCGLIAHASPIASHADDIINAQSFVKARDGRRRRV
jgi:hypothetical protein